MYEDTRVIRTAFNPPDSYFVAPSLAPAPFLFHDLGTGHLVGCYEGYTSRAQENRKQVTSDVITAPEAEKGDGESNT